MIQFSAIFGRRAKKKTASAWRGDEAVPKSIGRIIHCLDVLDDVGVQGLLEIGVAAVGGALGEGVGHGLGADGRRAGQEDDLAVGRLGHSLHGLEITDLHGGGAAQDIGGLAHELGGLDLGARSNDLGLSDPLALGGHGQRFLELVAEDDVLDKHALDLHAPAGRDVLDDLANGLRDLLTALDDILEHARAHDVPQRRLCTLDQRRAHVGDAERGLVGRRDVVVDDGREVERDVVLGHADLLGDLWKGN